MTPPDSPVSTPPSSPPAGRFSDGGFNSSEPDSEGDVPPLGGGGAAPWFASGQQDVWPASGGEEREERARSGSEERAKSGDEAVLGMGVEGIVHELVSTHETRILTTKDRCDVP